MRIYENFILNPGAFKGYSIFGPTSAMHGTGMLAIIIYIYIYIYIYIPPMDDLRCQYPFFSICLSELIQKFNALIYLYNRQKPNGLRLYTVYPTAPKKLTESNGDMRQHDITPESPGLWSIRRTSMPCMSRVFDQESANGGLMVISWLFNGGWMV